MGTPKMFKCPNCDADGSQVDAFGVYFYIFECSDCGERFCHHCEASHNGNYCAHCGKSNHFSRVGQVWKD